MIRSPPATPWTFCCLVYEWILNSTPHKTFDYLKVSLLAPFTDISREESTLTWSHYRSKIQHVTKAEDGFIFFFLFIFLFTLFSCNTTKIKFKPLFLILWEINSFYADLNVTAKLLIKACKEYTLRFGLKQIKFQYMNVYLQFLKQHIFIPGLRL